MIDEFESLLEINGIGEETLADIKNIYPSRKDLINALRFKRVPLRNDIVKKLQKALL